MGRLNAQLRTEGTEPIEISIGIHTGALVAGVIGTHKFVYDVWGDTVNTASRMESHGSAGKIQVTEDAKRALGDTFQFESRGRVEIRGKGTMELYYLRERISGSPTPLPPYASKHYELDPIPFRRLAMERREFVFLIGGSAAWPLVARAQQTVKPVIGFLSISSPGAHAPFVAAFNLGLKELGFIEGQNLAIEYRWAEGQFDRLAALAADLIRRKVDVIAAVSGDVSIRAAMDASSAIPVVFITGSDPVQTGEVASFARPGGNVTGFSMISNDLMSKRF